MKSDPSTSGKGPSLTEKSKNFVGAMARAAGRGVCGGRVLASDDEFDMRMSICASDICGSFDPTRIVCVVCGCPLKEKLSLTTEKCPLGYWEIIND